MNPSRVNTLAAKLTKQMCCQMINPASFRVQGENSGSEVQRCPVKLLVLLEVAGVVITITIDHLREQMPVHRGIFQGLFLMPVKVWDQ